MYLPFIEQVESNTDKPKEIQIRLNVNKYKQFGEKMRLNF